MTATTPAKGTPSIPHDSNGIKMVTMPISAILIEKRMREVDEKKVQEISESMGEIGLLHPIVINSSNKLIAGAHRLAAARLLGWTEIKCSVVNLEGLDLELAEIDENLKRNDLHYTDQAMLDKRRKEIYLLKYPETKVGIAQSKAMNAKKKGKKGRHVRVDSTSTSEPEIKPKSFVEDTSDKTGQSESTVKQSVQMATNIIPEAMPVLKENDIPKKDALVLARETPENQKKIIEKIKKQPQAKKSVIRAKEQLSHEEKKEELKNASPPMPDGFFDVIYIDPPWSLEDKGSRIAPDDSTTFKYPTMTISDIIAKQPPVDENAVMFLWVPATMIREALQLCDAWGFTYKTHAVWDKGKIGMGHYFRTQHEDLFFAIKGNICTSAVLNQSSVLRFERREHSRKPDELYDIIESMYPKRRYLECYARDAPTREGWTAWGNES